MKRYLNYQFDADDFLLAKVNCILQSYWLLLLETLITFNEKFAEYLTRTPKRNGWIFYFTNKIFYLPLILFLKVKGSEIQYESLLEKFKNDPVTLAYVYIEEESALAD